eukprot:8922340-Pyramimonas_sp.AAC.1
MESAQGLEAMRTACSRPAVHARAHSGNDRPRHRVRRCGYQHPPRIGFRRSFAHNRVVHIVQAAGCDHQ